MSRSPAEEPGRATLFEVMRIPLADIFAQNAKMQAGEDKEADIHRHAEEWIAKHRKQFNAWLAEARKAAEIAAGRAGQGRGTIGKSKARLG